MLLENDMPFSLRCVSDMLLIVHLSHYIDKTHIILPPGV